MKRPYPVAKDPRAEWTKTERMTAEKAVYVHSIDDMVCRLQKIYHKKTGHRYNVEDYLRLETSVFDKKEILLLDKDHKTLAFINGNVPEDIHKHTFDSVKSIMINYNPESQFQVKGDEVPPGVHPSNVVLESSSGGIKQINRGQVGPYPPKERLDNAEEYAMLKTCFNPLFRYIEDNLHNHLPEDTKTLSITVESSPFKEFSPAYPFHGFVLNMNICTNIHRDAKDLHLCLVLPLDYVAGFMGWGNIIDSNVIQ
ncbi:hypothetical protein EUX98_g7388 [Antrodiella citrinella]|uniref:Uncharacterized protein n=1 Tax=Antrodiella citrinella TaxID=2447956 RepID=A0A4S4MNC9_9APHY|nr:hypothetical protein EUX98_g7388 [Antrodiella citrinella]